MKLYHAANSASSQKVRMVLHEKALNYDEQQIDLLAGAQFDDEYRSLNPNAVVPTLVDNGATLVESTQINEYLDDAYPQHPLKPTDAAQRHQMRLLCRQLDESLHQACGDITYAIVSQSLLELIPKQAMAAQIARMPNPLNRHHRQEVFDQGVHSQVFVDAIAKHHHLFDDLDQQLAQSQWTAGDSFSLSDCALAPYLLRVDHLGLTPLITQRSNLDRWYKAMQFRPAFEKTASQMSDVFIKLMRENGVALAEDIAEYVVA